MAVAKKTKSRKATQQSSSLVRSKTATSKNKSGKSTQSTHTLKGAKSGESDNYYTPTASLQSRLVALCT